MGLAASQGRLLLLTARKSDLEYRAQEISQRRLLLATELESVSSKYARKTANRQMKLAMTVTQSEGNRTTSVNLTYARLMDFGKAEDDITSDYRIKNAKGEIVVPSESQFPKDPSSLSEEEKTDYPYAMIAVVNNGTDDNGNPKETTKTADLSYNKTGNRLVISGTDANGNTIYDVYVVDKNLADNSSTENYFQEGLRNGKFIIEQRNADDTNGDGTWAPQGWSGMTAIEDNYYTDDDAAAQAEYQSASARVQAQDKKLETDQKQIETQHKAVETEFESVSKVIQNNIENSFKMFS